MLDIQTVDPQDLNMTARLITAEAISRGWKAWIYYIGSGFLRFERPDGKRLEIFGSVPPTSTFSAAWAANNKQITNMLMAENGIRIPESHLADDLDLAEQAASELLASGRTVVVKPLNAAHGHGITMHVTDLKQMFTAFELAQQFSSQVLIQEQVQAPIDTRLTCVDFKCLGAVVRIPARVMGDGEHTYAELIARENERPERGEKYRKPLNIIDVEAAQLYLAERYTTVPAANQWHQVVAVANFGAGGEIVDITDETPAWLFERAEQVARIMGLPVCGVDFLLKAVPQPAMTETDLDPIMLEANKSPVLFFNEMQGMQKRGVPKAFIDYLEKL